MSDLEVCWHGARWREFPVRVGAPVVSARKTQEPLKGVIARIVAAVPQAWTQPQDIADRVGLSRRQTLAYLREAWIQGAVDRQEIPVGTHKSLQVWYRRSAG